MPKTSAQNTPDPADQDASWPAERAGEADQPSSHTPERRPDATSHLLKNAYYAIWSALGLILIALLAVAVLGSGSWAENLNLTGTSPTGAPPGAESPPPPPQPSQEQLDCVRQEVGDERFAELERGEFADEEETQIVQDCLEDT